MTKLKRMVVVWLSVLLFGSTMAIVPAGASDLDAGVDSAEEVEEALEETLAEVPAIEELVEETLADVADLEINENADVVVELETSDGSTVEIPDEADEPIVLENAEGDVLEVELPGNGDDAEVLDDGSVVYEDAVTDTDIVVQAQEDGGVRIIAVIDGEGAPSRFEFPVEVGDGERLEVGSDGTAAVVDSDDFVVSLVEVPWAFDANGASVPTTYSASGNNLVLNVAHSAAEYAYPIVADPRWTWGWVSGTAYFSRWETTEAAGSAATVMALMVGIPGGFTQAVAWYAANIAAWASSALLWSDKCLKVKYGMSWSWRGGTPGVTPGHYTNEAGVRCR